MVALLREFISVSTGKYYKILSRDISSLSVAVRFKVKSLRTEVIVKEYVRHKATAYGLIYK